MKKLIAELEEKPSTSSKRAGKAFIVEEENKPSTGGHWKNEIMKKLRKVQGEEGEMPAGDFMTSEL